MPHMPHMPFIFVCFELLASTYQITLDALVSGENVVLQKKLAKNKRTITNWFTLITNKQKYPYTFRHMRLYMGAYAPFHTLDMRDIGTNIMAREAHIGCAFTTWSWWESKANNGEDEAHNKVWRNWCPDDNIMTKVRSAMVSKRNVTMLAQDSRSSSSLAILLVMP